MKKAVVPILIIATGIGWMLSSNNFMPAVDWAFVLLLATAGILAMIQQLTKISVVIGPLLMVSSVLMVMLQTNKISIEMGFPILVITFGMLLLIARLSSLPDGMQEVEREARKKEKEEKAETTESTDS